MSESLIMRLIATKVASLGHRNLAADLLASAVRVDRMEVCLDEIFADARERSIPAPAIVRGYRLHLIDSNSPSR